jgi:hypothetical protein
VELNCPHCEFVFMFASGVTGEVHASDNYTHSVLHGYYFSKSQLPLYAIAERHL